jgi:protoheme IX farnesyltransferase
MAAATAILRPSTTDVQPVSLHASTWTDYWSLMKPEVNLLVVVTTGFGFYRAWLTSSREFAAFSFLHTLLATFLVASGAATLNQFAERRFDSQMRRTARRPLPSGRIDPFAALCFGMTLVVAGVVYLMAALNVLAGLLAVVTVAIYIGLYTPLKRKTPLCTLVGAVAGALPPLIGWAAASGRLAAGTWLLFAVLFFWQFPHFMAIAWIYRRDYARAGFHVLPPGRSGRSWMIWQAMLPTAALVMLTVGQALLDGAAGVFVVTYLLLGTALVGVALQLGRERSNSSARRLLLASIAYLPALLLLIMVQKTRPAISVFASASRPVEAMVVAQR